MILESKILSVDQIVFLEHTVVKIEDRWWAWLVFN